jgi:hypothetical protein
MAEAQTGYELLCVRGENVLDREGRLNFEQKMNGFSETGVGMPNVQRLWRIYLLPIILLNHGSCRTKFLQLLPAE